MLSLAGFIFIRRTVPMILSPRACLVEIQGDFALLGLQPARRELPFSTHACGLRTKNTRVIRLARLIIHIYNMMKSMRTILITYHVHIHIFAYVRPL